MLLSFLEAERFALLAQNSQFQLKKELPFGTRKKTGKYEKMIADHGSPSWKLNALLQKLVVKDISHLL